MATYRSAFSLPEFDRESDNLDTPVDMSPKRSVRVLSCRHAMSEEAIKKCLKKKKNKVICPACKAETTVKDGDIKELPKDYNNTALYRLVRDNTITYRNHLVLKTAAELAESDSDNLVTGNFALRPGPNDIHYGEYRDLCSCQRRFEVAYYCEDCSDFICDRCSKLEHLVHQVRNLDEIAGNYRETIEMGLSQLEEYVQELVYMSQQLRQYGQETSTSFEKVKKRILQQGEHLKQLVDERCSELINEVDSIKQENGHLINDKKLEIHKTLGSLGEQKQKSQETLSKGTNLSLIQEAEELQDAVTSFELLDPPEYKLNIEYWPSSEEREKADVADLCGRLHVQRMAWGAKTEGMRGKGFKKEVWGHIYENPKLIDRPLPQTPEQKRPPVSAAENGKPTSIVHPKRRDHVYESLNDVEEYLEPRRSLRIETKDGSDND